MKTTWSRLLIGLAMASALVIPVTSGSGVARAGGTTTEATLSGPAIGGVVPEEPMQRSPTAALTPLSWLK
jgi:hypothetical protein